ncbi:hypothetical protein CVS40_4495 [Lucilia cuprina]|nr:hypothetical protein CVS40_4495 [Lucilia cuprina]
MDSALDPLDLVKHSERIEKHTVPTIDTDALAQYLEEIAQEAANLINRDSKQEFLYKNPNGWQQKKLYYNVKKFYQKTGVTKMDSSKDIDSTSSNSISFAAPSSSTSSEELEIKLEPWSLIEDFKFPSVVHQINEFIQTWELSSATKFVVIALDKIEHIPLFGKRYYVEAHFSKPTPKCPNPLAVAKVYFQINVSHLLPSDYPVNVTYKFESYKSQFYAMGALKISSNKFQRYYIDSILHMKLSFYAELCECRNPLKPLEKRKKSEESEAFSIGDYFFCLHVTSSHFVVYWTQKCF